MKKVILSSKKRSRIMTMILVFFLLSVTIKVIAKEEELPIGGVDIEDCLSCGICCQIDPVDIRMGRENSLIIINPLSNVAQFQIAISSCPVSALWLNY